MSRRGGVLTHPSMMSILSYPASSSPIRAIAGPATLPFLRYLPRLAADAAPKRRRVIVFTPDRVVKRHFWPEPGSLAGLA